MCGCPKQPEEGIGFLVPELQAVVDCLVEVLGTEVRSAAKIIKWSQPLSLSLSSPGECFKIAMLPRLLLSSSAQMILCPWSPESWDSRHTPSYLANLYLMGTERPSKL